MTQNKSFLTIILALLFILKGSSVFSMEDEMHNNVIPVQKTSHLLILEDSIQIERPDFQSQRTLHKDTSYILLTRLSPQSPSFEDPLFNPSEIAEAIQTKMMKKDSISRDFPLLISCLFKSRFSSEETRKNIPFHTVQSVSFVEPFQNAFHLHNPSYCPKLIFTILGGYAGKEAPQLTLQFTVSDENFPREGTIFHTLDLSAQRAHVRLRFPHPFKEKNFFDIDISSQSYVKGVHKFSRSDLSYYDASTGRLYKNVSEVKKTYGLDESWRAQWDFKILPEAEIFFQPTSNFEHTGDFTQKTLIPSPYFPTGYYRIQPTGHPQFDTILKHEKTIFMASRQYCMVSRDGNAKSCLEAILLTPSSLLISSNELGQSLKEGFYKVRSGYTFLAPPPGESSTLDPISISSSFPPSFSMTLDTDAQILEFQRFSGFQFLETLVLKDFRLSSVQSPSVQTVLGLAHTIGACPFLKKLSLENCFEERCSSLFFDALREVKNNKNLPSLTEFEFQGALTMNSYGALIECLRALNIKTAVLPLPDPVNFQVLSRKYIVYGTRFGMVGGTSLAAASIIFSVFGGPSLILPALILKETAVGTILTNLIAGATGGGVAGGFGGWLTAQGNDASFCTALKQVLALPTLTKITLQNPTIDPALYELFINQIKGSKEVILEGFSKLEAKHLPSL